MAELKHRKGDLFEALDEFLEEPPQSGEADKAICVPHVCNDKGAWGAGFVLSLSKWWDHPETAYKEWHSTGQWRRMAFEMGRVQTLDSANNRVYVANMIAQTLGGVKPLRYAALGHCMYAVMKRLQGDYCYGIDHPEFDASEHHELEIWCPKFGSGLAGGSWPHIEEMVRETWVDEFGVNVTVFSR